VLRSAGPTGLFRSLSTRPHRYARGIELALKTPEPEFVTARGNAMSDDTYHRIVRIGSLILAVIVACCASQSNASEYGISCYRPGIMDLFSGYLGGEERKVPPRFGIQPG
jgi:hypothetical protein